MIKFLPLIFLFQSTLPREERHKGYNFYEAGLLFQSTLPREERLSLDKPKHKTILFQSTLPREERHFWVIHKGYNFYISIHAPTRGATPNASISQCCNVVISIHAPTRGATARLAVRVHILLEFQSTLPREERLLLSACFLALSNFNPRSHERSDVFRLVCKSKIRISIHAPTRGATIRVVEIVLCLLFQSTLPREERPLPPALSSPGAIISIHAPTRGATFRC